MSSTQQPSTPSSALCTSCGLCCDGTLFGRVPLMPGEEVNGELKEGAHWTESKGGPAFRLPCPALAGVCRIYPDRPKACSTFRCRLLRDCEEGAVPWGRAQELVHAARGLRDSLREAIIGTLGHTDRSRPMQAEMLRIGAHQGEDETDEEFRIRMGEALVTHAALAQLLDNHFRLRTREGEVTPPEEMGAARSGSDQDIGA